MVLILLLARPSQDSNLSSLRPSMNSMLLLDKLRIFKWFNLQTWDIRTNSLLQADNWMGVERKTQLNEEKQDWKGLGIPIIKLYTYWAILKVSLESKLSVNESKLFPWSSRFILIPFRTFRGPLFSKPVTGQELFLTVSYSKPALTRLFKRFPFLA